MEVLTVKEINDECFESIPLERFELIGAKFETDPELPGLELLLNQDDSYQPSLYLIVFGERKENRIAFLETVPVRIIPNVAIPLRDVINEGFTKSAAQLLEDAVLTVIKRDVRFIIKRPLPCHEDVEIILSIGAFKTIANCMIFDLAGFISQEPETEQEYSLRRIREWENKF